MYLPLPPPFARGLVSSVLSSVPPLAPSPSPSVRPPPRTVLSSSGYGLASPPLFVPLAIGIHSGAHVPRRCFPLSSSCLFPAISCACLPVCRPCWSPLVPATSSLAITVRCYSAPPRPAAPARLRPALWSPRLIVVCLLCLVACRPVFSPCLPAFSDARRFALLCSVLASRFQYCSDLAFYLQVAPRSSDLLWVPHHVGTFLLSGIRWLLPSASGIILLFPAANRCLPCFCSHPWEVSSS